MYNTKLPAENENHHVAIAIAISKFYWILQIFEIFLFSLLLCKGVFTCSILASIVTILVSFDAILMYFKAYGRNIILKLTSKVDISINPLQNCFKTYRYCDNSCKYCTCRWTHFFKYWVNTWKYRVTQIKVCYFKWL